MGCTRREDGHKSNSSRQRNLNSMAHSDKTKIPARTLASSPFPTPISDRPPCSKNRAGFANVIYTPKSALLFAREYRRLFTAPAFSSGALYESGSTRRIRFRKIGLSYIFCNIHPDMSAVVLTLQTPYFAKTTADGYFQINNLPPGKYKLEIWHELVSEEELAGLAQQVR